MKSNVIVLWLMIGGGVFLLYCAVKNYTPQSLITSYFDKSVKPSPFGSTSNSVGGGSSSGSGNTDHGLPILPYQNGVTTQGLISQYPSGYVKSPGTFIA